MKNKLDVLIAFQTLETDLARLGAALEKIPERIEALDVVFLDLKQRISEKSDSLAALKKEYRAKEIEVETNLSRIKKSREKMDAVKTNKEYQSILKEIQDMQDKNSLIEDEMLAVLDRIESGQKDLKQLNEKMLVLEKKVTDQKAIIQKEADELKQQLSIIKQKKDDQYLLVDPKMLETYNRVKLRVGAFVVVPVTKAVCKGCHLTIPPQMYNELQRQDSLQFCPHCHRIIYSVSEET
ncbi:MAG: C4-type zinc ribbon domain-containing protein [Desulfobacterales bacterium]|jgi:predicted  nucleic acid-binding Zn-ribbon protein|nr:C4-type zinc ribbon domain-containing protein [Desulfobacterales bacterium]